MADEEKDMNVIDIIVCVILLVAIWKGWRQGLVLQIGALAGIVAGIWLAWKFGATVGAWLGMSDKAAYPGGFTVVLIVVIIVLALVARLLRKIFKFAGLGPLDSLLGVCVSIFKYMLLLGVLFSAFERLNTDYDLVNEQRIEQSKSFRPIERMSNTVLPFIKKLGEEMQK